jgi:hypothetical protein
MRQVEELMRNALAVVGLLALGYWLGSSRPVAASSTTGSMEFQLSGVDQNSSLLVYQPEAKAVYVYRGATLGNETVNCSYKFLLGEPGGPVKRVNCPVGSAFH